MLEELKAETRTIVLYEAPHRLVRTLEELLEQLGNRRLTICRELTKKHETVFQTTLEQAITYYNQQEPKGECVLVIEGVSFEALAEEERKQWEEMSIAEHVEFYMNQEIDKKAAMKQVAVDRGISKREVYQALLENT